MRNLRALCVLTSVLGACSADTGALAPSVPKIVTTELPAAAVGVAYSAVLVAESGVEPYRFSLVLPTLPRGLTLDGAGRIFGTPSESGRFAIGVEVTDAMGTKNETLLALVVASVDPSDTMGTCESPKVLDLSSGRATVTFDLATSFDRTSVACRWGSGDYNPETVVAIELAERRDLRLSSGLSELFASLRTADCVHPEELACGEVNGFFVPALAPGRYLLVLEPWLNGLNTSFSAEVMLSPPTPAPTNDRCEAATELTFDDRGEARAFFDLAGARVPAETLECGEGRTVHFSFALERPSVVEVSTTPGAIDSNVVPQVAVVRGLCPGGQVESCDATRGCVPRVLEPGQYFILLRDGVTPVRPASGELTVVRHDAVAGAWNARCDTPAGLILDARGRVTVRDDLDASAPIESPSGSWDCRGSKHRSLYYAIDLDTRSDVHFDSVAPSWPIDIAFDGGACAASRELECLSTGTERVVYGVPAGRFTFEVFGDGDEEPGLCRFGRSRAFALSVEAVPSPPVPTNDRCESATLVGLSAIGTSASILGTLAGANDDLSMLECQGFDTEARGGDVFYRVELGAPGRLRVTSNPWAPIRMALSGPDCARPSELFCDGGGLELDTNGVLPAGIYHLRVEGRTLYQTDAQPDFLLDFALD